MAKTERALLVPDISWRKAYWLSPSVKMNNCLIITPCNVMLTYSMLSKSTISTAV